jgi:hypothetical protein
MTGRRRRFDHGPLIPASVLGELGAGLGMTEAEVQASLGHLERHGWVRRLGPGTYELDLGEDCPGPGLCPEWSDP